MMKEMNQMMKMMIFFGLFTTERNDVREETTSVSPVLTSTETVTQSRILKALTEKNPQENVVGNVITPLPTEIVAVTPLPTEAVLQNVITVQPVSNVATQVSTCCTICTSCPATSFRSCSRSS